MAAPLNFKVLIIGGGIAGLSLALMLEAYGFDYELLEKHSDVAPKLGAGVGLTPNGARILDQIGVWEEMCGRASPVNAGTAVSPGGQTVIFNPNMGEWLDKLFGYKIHFLSRHDCLRILYERIQRKSHLHMRKEVVKIKLSGGKTLVETQDGSVFTGDIIVGADGVRSHVRRELWRIADSEKPGYIPKSDKAGIVSFYTAVVGIAYDPGLPEGGSARAYNDKRSYFFQEGRVGSGEFYWWLCAKNEQTKKGIIPKLTAEVKQGLVDRYAGDRIGPDLTLGELYKKSVYSAVIPLQEFVLQKCYYRNILLIGDSFRKLHPVAGQGANSAVEESAFLADILWDLRDKGALHDGAKLKEALEEFQRERVVRVTALRDDANLVQRMESLDNPVMKFMALHVIPRLPFVVAFLPQLGSSFTPARSLQHLPAPKAGLCPFLPDMKARPRPRSPLASLSWIAVFVLSASVPWWIGHYFPINLGGLSDADGALTKLSGSLQLYTSVIGIAISGFWVTESYKPSSLVSPFTSALPWILASNHWGWERTLPAYLSLHLALSQGVVYYHTPQTMSDLAVAKSLLPTLIMVYTVPLLQSLTDSHESAATLWNIAHCALPVISYLTSKALRAIDTIPTGIDAVFSNLDIPYQRSFQTAITFGASALHISLLFNSRTVLFEQGTNLLSLPVTKSFLSLTALTTSWCLYTTWERARIKALDVSVPRAWGYVLLSTVLCGPAATLAGTWSWCTTQLAKATSFQDRSREAPRRSKKRSMSNLTRIIE